MVKMKNLKPEDVLLIEESTCMPRNVWLLGVVTNTFPDKMFDNMFKQ